MTSDIVFADLEQSSSSAKDAKEVLCSVVPTRDELDPASTSKNAKTTTIVKKETDNDLENPDNTNKTITCLGNSNEEIIRVIAQLLKELGVNKTVKTLLSETGCYLEHPVATKLRKNVLSGQWYKAQADLMEIEPLIENGKSWTMKEMRFIMLEQQYLELLEDGCTLEAVNFLKNEMKPLHHNFERFEKIHSYITCTDNHDLHQTAKWQGKGSVSRALVMQKLQKLLPPSVMLSPGRLRTLLQQAVELQIQKCLFHDIAWETNLENVSLLADHSCATDDFPLKTIQLLSDHSDEVWLCRFSPDGLKLATGCRGGTVYIWGVDPETLQLKKMLILNLEIQMRFVFMDWSYDSKMLLLGYQKNPSPFICVVNIEECRLLAHTSDMDLDASLCGTFNRDGTRFVCASQKGLIYLCDLNGTVLESWEGIRTNSIVYRSDNKTILAADNRYRIRAYNFANPRTDDIVLEEKDRITTFTVNSADNLALLNISNQSLHLWDLKNNSLIRSFQGTQKSNFALISCFGGRNENFVASGSLDNNICIWNLKHEEPIAKLSGHSATVNCVSWNPAFPSLLASASDDTTVRIWGPTTIYHGNLARQHHATNMNISCM